MYLMMRSPLGVCLAVMFLFNSGLAAAFADAPQVPPQAPSAAETAHKNNITWNFMDMALTGRVTIGYDRLFRIGSRYYGLYAQYISPMNTVFIGVLTGHQTPLALSDEVQFPSGVDFYVSLHGRGRTRAMRYFPRIGLSLVKNPGESESALYASFGPCGRIAFGKNFHVTFALTTLKIKLRGGANYNWLQLPLFDLSLGIGF